MPSEAPLLPSPFLLLLDVTGLSSHMIIAGS